MAIYLHNKDLLLQLEISKKNGELTVECIRMFQMMSVNLSRRFSYLNEEDRKDCIAVAVMDCFQYWQNFDASKSDNAFAYFTQVIKNGFGKEWKILHRVPQSQMTRLDLFTSPTL